MRGGSWISSPRPWPVECTNASSSPYAFSTWRAAASTRAVDDARTHGVDARQLRLQHRAIRALHLRRGRAQEEHAGHIAAIAILQGAHVHHHQVTGLQPRGGGLRVRQARSARRLPRWSRTTASPRPDGASDTPVPPPDPAPSCPAGRRDTACFERAGIGLHRAADQRDLVRRLHHAQSLRPSPFTGTSVLFIGSRASSESQRVASHPRRFVADAPQSPAWRSPPSRPAPAAPWQIWTRHVTSCAA